VNRRVLFQKGELTCNSAARHTKVYHYSHRDVTVNFTIWPHNNVPCGAAAAKIERAWHNKHGEHLSTWIRELTLNDFGIDKSDVQPE
jgi:hypothetical protein